MLATVTHLVFCLLTAATVLEIYQVVAQTSMMTNGKSGTVCEDGQRCLSGATCETHKDKQRCVCPPPLVGHGRLGCFPPGAAVIYIQTDPHLKTLYNEYVNLATPCRYLILHYTLTNLDGTLASVQVFSENRLFPAGQYYVTSVLLCVSVIKGGDMKKRSLLVEGLASKGEYDFLLHGIDDSELHTTADSTIDLTNFMVNTSLEKEDNFLVLRVDGTGLTVRFRPPAADQDLQSMEPGVTMVIDADLLDRINFVPGHLSSSPKGPSFLAESKRVGLSKQNYVYFLGISSTPPSPMDDRICHDTSIFYNSICRNDGKRLALLDTCGQLYSDKTFLSCLSENNVMDSAYQDQKLFFRYCVQAFCQESVDICEGMLDRIVSMSNCPLPIGMANLNCATEVFRF